MLFKVPFETPFHHPPVHHFWPQAKQTKIPFLAEGQKKCFGRRPKQKFFLAEGQKSFIIFLNFSPFHHPFSLILIGIFP